MGNIYVYALVDPRDGKVKYVGKSVDPEERYKQHLRDLRGKTPKINWIKHLLSIGKKPELCILEVCTKDNWEAREAEWIKHYKKVCPSLKNGTDGGDGCSYWSGKHRREETKKKWALANQGEKSGKAKLKEHDIIQIIEMYKSGVSTREISEMFCIAIPTVSGIVLGRRWKHLGLFLSPSEQREISAKRTSGENHGMAKLTIGQVAEIRDLYSTGNITQRELGSMFGVNHATVGRIIRFETWKGVS